MSVELLLLTLFVISPAAAFILIELFRNGTKRKLYELQAEMYTKALEHGQSVPPDLFAEPRKLQKRSSKSLNAGIVCIFVGIGIFLTCWIIAATAPNETMAEVFTLFSSLGIIPFFIGIAFVIIHFITKKESVSENAQ